MSKLIRLSDYKQQKQDQMKNKQDIQKEERESLGSGAWSHLKRKKTRLSKKDRKFIATQLDIEINRLESKFGVKPGVLAAKAGFSDGAKELYRLRLPEDGDAEKRQLRADPRKYVDLITAIRNTTGENIHILVDRLTCGTSIHPVNVKDAEGVRQLECYLQGLVTKVDKEFDLLSQFNKTAALKSEHIRQGGLQNWPLYDLFQEDYIEPVYNDLGLPKGMQKKLGLADIPGDRLKLRDIDISLLAEDVQELAREKMDYYRRETQVREEIINGCHCYWDEEWSEKHYEGMVGIDLEEALKYLPYMEIGVVTDWAAWRRLYGTEEVTKDKVLKSLYEEYSQKAPGEDVPNSDTELKVWLAIYPNYDSTGLIPVLFAHDLLVGYFAYLMTSRNLVMFQDWYVVCDEVVSLYDHIKRLMGYEIEGSPLLNEWRNTAQHLEGNPFLAKHIKKQISEKRFQEKMRSEIYKDVYDEND